MYKGAAASLAEVGWAEKLADRLDPPDLRDGSDLLPHQKPPPGFDWWVWLLMGGRGAGKTYASSRYFSRYMRTHAGARGSIIAPTLGDARLSCVEGPSGLKTIDPTVRVVKTPDYHLLWPNGSRADIFGAHSPDDVERLRAGGNRHVVWAEELAAWRQLQDAWDQMSFGLRLGDHPHVIASTTPKNRPLIRELVGRKDVVQSHAHTDDNPYLAAIAKARLYERYEGTTLGRQELAGELIEDIEGALWNRNWIEETRRKVVPVLGRVVVGVDPAVTNKKTSDETGIVVAGRVRGACPCGKRDCFYVMEDVSGKFSPSGWARKVVAVYDVHRADKVIAEVNNGGDLVTEVMRRQDESLPVKVVRASRGKVVRAEPIANLYEQRRVHHISVLPELEDQMCNWDPSEDDISPDRVDALVWALTELSGGTTLVLAAPETGEAKSPWEIK